MPLGTLYSSGPLCPFTHRVLIAAAELGQDVEVVYGREIPADVQKANLSGTWPAFVPADGGEVLQDSTEIVDHLIDQSGARGEAYRSDDDVLARLDVLIGCISKVLMAGVPSVQEEFRAKLDAALAEVEKMLASAGGLYLGGDDFSQAEGHVAPFLYRLPFLVEIRDHLPRVFLENEDFNAWVDRVVNRRSLRAIAPKRHVLRQFYAAKAQYGKPMKVGRLHHSGFRSMWNDLAARTAAIAGADDRDNEALQEARDLCYLLCRAVALHANFEDLVLFPALDTVKDDPAFTAHAVEQHDREALEMTSLLERFEGCLEVTPGSRQEALTALTSVCEHARKSQFEHLELEEARFLPVLAGLEVGQHLEMLRAAYEMCILERPHLIGVMASYMPIENTLSLLDSLLLAVEPDSEQWRILLSAMHSFLSAEQWLKVARRYEDVLPVSLLLIPTEHRRETLGSAAQALQAAAPVDRIEIPRRARQV